MIMRYNKYYLIYKLYSYIVIFYLLTGDGSPNNTFIDGIHFGLAI
jgi:hypothetical protein